MSSQDPWEILSNAASDPTLLTLLFGPIALLLVIMVPFVVWFAIRRRRYVENLLKEPDIAAGQKTLAESAAAYGGAEMPSLVDTAAPAVVDQPVASAPAATRELPGESAAALATAAAAATPVAAPSTEAPEVSWRAKLMMGLGRTRTTLNDALARLFQHNKIDAAVLEQVHEALYRADIGVATTDKIIAGLKDKLVGTEAEWGTVRTELRDMIAGMLTRAESTGNQPGTGPYVILVVGVNGVGKTTTIGKLAALFLEQEKSVLLGAADTFRAAAIEQLVTWGDRLGVEVIRNKAGSDPAAVAFDAVKAARARNTDVLMIDTAGRLHNKQNLMDELGKIKRILARELPGAPHETWLVIDATTGQNAFQQVRAFQEVVELTGLIVTKIDGTAKGGVIIGIADQFGVPVRYIGVGEKVGDLRPFSARDYADCVL